MIPGAIPSLNLPKKSFQSESASRRKLECHTESSAASSTSETETVSNRVYKHLDDFKRKVSKVKLSGWSRNEREQDFVIEYFDGKHALPVYSVTVDSGLGFSVAVFGWCLPDDHHVYLEHKRSLFRISISSLCSTIQSMCICPGLPKEIPATDHLDAPKHSPLLIDVYDEDGPPFQVDMFTRCENCMVLCGSNNSVLCAQAL